MSVIQSVLFNVNYWSIREAEEWLNNHNLHAIKDPEITKRFIHFRIFDPKVFKRFRTIKTRDHMDIIIGLLS